MAISSIKYKCVCNVILKIVGGSQSRYEGGSTRKRNDIFLYDLEEKVDWWSTHNFTIVSNTLYIRKYCTFLFDILMVVVVYDDH